jgi:hypothetical protein
MWIITTSITICKWILIVWLLVILWGGIVIIANRPKKKRKCKYGFPRKTIPNQQIQNRKFRR